MSIPQVVESYFDAWNRRDAAAIVATFDEQGTYSDPTTGHPLSGGAIGAYAEALWGAFPDLSFEIRHVGRTAPDSVAAEWVMRGTNSGPFRDLPPTHRTVAVPGADFIRLDGGKIRSVQGYFDSRAVPDQLGLQVHVLPHAVGPFSFGIASAVQSGGTAKPGAFGVTSLKVRSAEEEQQVRALSREIATEMLGMPGFIGWVGATIGDRMITLTAWETEEASRQLMRAKTHAKAVPLFFGPDIGSGGMTGVCVPARATLWVRCAACDRVADQEAQQGVCVCGAELPKPQPYW